MDEHKDTAREQQEASKKVPPPAPPPADPPQPPPNPNPEQEDRPEKMSKSDKIMIWATCVIAAGTIVSAGAIVLQWREMVSGGTATDNLVNYAKVQANAASDQAEAAQQFSDTSEDINGRMSEAVDQLNAAASSAKAGIEATQESMRQEQRAWAGMMQITGIPEAGKPFHATVIFQNTGRTPAIDFVSQERMVALGENQVFSPNWIAKPPAVQSHTVLFPNQKL